MGPDTAARIRRELLELVPWTIELEIAEGVSTAAAREASAAAARQAQHSFTFVNPRDGFVKTLRTLYPTGLNQRSFLDAGCQCGAFCIWAKELGAGRTLGLDPSATALRQAHWVQRYRKFPLLEFAGHDLSEPVTSGTPRFDIVLFRGVFQRVRNPLAALQHAADLTREVLIVTTPVAEHVSPEPGDGALYWNAATGNWLPSGPQLLLNWLRGLQFAELKLHYHTRARVPQPTAPPSLPLGYVEVVAARIPGLTERVRTSLS